MLTDPVEVLGDDKGWVRGIRCVRMELGEPDQSGRRSPIEIEGSEFDIECDVVIMALGALAEPANRIDHARFGDQPARLYRGRRRAGAGRRPAKVFLPAGTL